MIVLFVCWNSLSFFAHVLIFTLMALHCNPLFALCGHKATKHTWRFVPSPWLFLTSQAEYYTSLDYFPTQNFGSVILIRCRLWNVECFKHLGSLLTNDGRCTREIKSRIAMAKAAFSMKNTLFTSKLDLNLRKKLIKCYIWSMALYGAETWTLRAVDQKYLESFEMWCWRRMEIS